MTASPGASQRARGSEPLRRLAPLSHAPWPVTWFVYILASDDRRFLYTGEARDLRERVGQHRAGTVEAWSRAHRTHRLVWFEPHGTLREALVRERAIKRWRRAWKQALIEGMNPDWRDLAGEIPL